MSTRSPNSEAPYVVVTHDPNIVPKHVVAACFDGGGVHAIAAVVVLKAIMDRLEAELYVPQADRLHEHFDMLAGTGTGGLLAILLGRLRVSLDEERIIDIYKSLFQGQSESLFEANMRSVVRDYEPDKNADAQLLDDRQDALSVYVVAPQTEDATGISRTLRSDTVDNEPRTIVEAALAICPTPAYPSATSNKSPKLKISIRKKEDEPIRDDSMVHNNPSLLLIREAREKYGPGVRFALFLSVGSGMKTNVTPSSLERAIDTDLIHELVLDSFTSTNLGLYLRIDVPGIEDIAPHDYDAIQSIQKRTAEYLKTDSVAKAIDRAAGALQQHVRASPASHASGYIAGSRNMYDDGDVSRYFVVKKCMISIGFTQPMLKSRKRTVQVVCLDYSNDPIPAVLDEHDGQSGDFTRQRWTFDHNILVFPGESLAFQLVSDGKMRAEFSVSYESIAKLYAEGGVAKEHRDVPKKLSLATARSPPPQNWSITLDVSMGDIDNLIAPESSKELNYLLDNGEIFTARTNNKLLGSIEKIQNFLESNPLVDKGWKVLEGAVDIVKDAHPLASVVITALKIPYYLLQNAAKFVQDIQNLANAMCFACKCLVTVRYHTTNKLARDLFVNVMRLVRNAAVFIDVYCKKGQIRQVIETQFPARLDGFSRDLQDTSHKFEVAMLLQIACEIDQIAYESSDSFLLKRLRPAEQQPLGECCLRDTRVNTLQKVRAWLDDSSSNNILWIVGPPGVGKSTIATTIVKDDDHPCIKFFATRNFPDLRDTRRIWPTIAHSLTRRHDGLKAAIMRALGKKRNIDVGDDTALDQFQNLIKEPLEVHSKENASASRSRANAYPVVIIDALDECESGKGWDSFLKSFGSWPNGIKLIITSRDNEELRERLSGACRLDLAPGDSTDDVEVFFIAKFGEMKLRPDFKNFGLGSDWPGDTDIQVMKDYAAGLFIWADMVINYVAPIDTAGFDPTERLRRVLSDVRDKGHLGIKGENRVDNLYARIIYDAFVLANDEERKRAKGILAIILLVKAPLRKQDLHEIMWSDKWNSRIVVESTLSNLRPIIPASDNEIRVFHKSVSDFGLSRERSMAALVRFVRSDVDRHSYVIDVEKENKELALACLHLMRRKLSTSNITELPTSSQTHPDGFPYARHHWFEHVEEAGNAYRPIISNLRYLAGAMEVAYRSLERFAEDLDPENNKGIALVGSVCGAIELAIQCVDSIDLEHNDFEASRKKLDECTRNLGVVRGEFQIAMVLRNQASTANTSSTDGFLLRQLAPSIQADLDDGCAPGTRTAILSQAREWLVDLGARKILWIVGAPGAGKSAVAASLVKKEFPNIRLCTKFFAKRDFADRRDPSLVWRTLIYDIARQHIGMRGSIMEALLGNSLSGSSDQSKHLELLFKAISDQQCLPVVAVIDALDECFRDDNEEWSALLDAITNSTEFPQTFKLVVTSRDFPDIRSALSGISHELPISTGTDASAESKSDIEVFFRSKLAGSPRASYWLSGDILPQLVGRAAGSFIWAKMFAGLVELNAHGQLEDIDIATGDAPGSTENVDVLYAKVLVETLGQLPEKEREDSRVLLSTLVLAEDPLRTETLESLPFNGLYRNQAHQSAKTILDGLSSIITVDKNLRVRIPHKSFSDFYLSRSRCQKAMEQLNLPTKEQHAYLMREQDDQGNLAIACLQWMCNTLTFNTYGISSSHVLNSKILQLEDEDHTLVYACRYWGEHLKHATRDDSFRAQAQPLLHIFFHQKVLFWLEILSLAKAVSPAKKSLGVAREFLEGYDNDLAVFADDVLKFVTHFEYPIAMAAPHVYVSALPFSPSNSRIFQVYAPRFPNLFSVTIGRRKDWGDAPVTGNGHDDEVWSVSFFQDGFRLASGSRDQTVRIWDSRTGKAISPPFKHDSLVLCIAVSPDGKLIASSESNGALSIWDSETGARKLNLTDGHSDVIESVVFSPDGSRIVTSGSRDNTVKVWDIASGELCLGPLTGHTAWVKSVAFSPDGTLIASGSRDETIRIWDATTGKSHREPLVGHSDLVLCLAFTADRRYLVSGCSDGTICLWDVIDGFTQTSFINSGSSVRSISFSPESEILASGHDDGSLHFWDLRAGELHQLCNPIHGHTNIVNSIAFSPDGQILASGSDDESVKIWVVPTVTTSKASHVGHTITGKPQCEASDLDQHGNQVLSDDCYIDSDGWLWDSHRDDAKVLFWVPEENRAGFWFPRNTAVIHKNVSKIDFSRFVHGENWAECAKLVESDK